MQKIQCSDAKIYTFDTYIPRTAQNQQIPERQYLKCQLEKDIGGQMQTRLLTCSLTLFVMMPYTSFLCLQQDILAYSHRE